MNAEVQAKGRVVVYAAGGTGINIAQMLSTITTNNDIMADIKIVMIDTSRANLSSAAMQKYDCYLLDGLDGSGKVRSENSDQIYQHVRDILQQHPPGDLNIMLSSAAGGSGSVIAPLLMSELLDREVPAVALTVGSVSSKLEAENSLKTLKSYEAIAVKRNAPVNMLYLQNSDKMPRSEVDNNMTSCISYLAVLFSRRNHGLDSRDLHNWLRYNKVTSFEAQLSMMTILIREPGDKSINEELSKLGSVISVATLAPDDASTDLEHQPEYQTVGFLPSLDDNNLGPNVLAGKAIRYVIFDGVKAQVVKELEKLLKSLAEKANARPPRSAIAMAGEADETGLVL